ncbi:MAG: hypothetical protein IPP35_05090 [Elusimicrobia bacterium]|nr:hypothetical protein [Elusimicrobiota bacterium]
MTTAVGPVKKIRKFRLHPRPSAVLRNLKSLLDNAQITPELEKAAEAEALGSIHRLDTAALYGTWTPAQAPAWMEPLWRPAPGGTKGPVCLTLYTATIGTGFELELAEALSRGEGLRARLLTALGEELADQAAHFIERLVSEEARQDSCELEDRRDFSDPQDIRATLELLDAARLAMSYDAASHLTPRFTRAGALPWGPPSKHRGRPK